MRGVGGIGIFGFAFFLDRFFGFCPKRLQFSVFVFIGVLRRFSFFSICFSFVLENTSGFSVLVSHVVFGVSYFVLFGFRFLFDLSGN